MRVLESLTGGYASSAKVVDGTLILSLPDAISPVVWRMDLGQVRSSALEVRAQKGGQYVLALKTPRDDVHDIAPFATRGKAVRALMAVSRAMQNSQGRLRTTTVYEGGAVNDTGSFAQSRSGRGRWVAGAVVLVVLLLLGSILLHQTPQTASFGGPADTSASSITTGGNVDAPGVPVSADDFLRQDKTAK